MQSELQLQGEGFEELALACCEKIGPASSKSEALSIVANFVSPLIEDYFRRVLEEPDEIVINFIELLDQIVFEITDNNLADSMMREYVADDLFARLAIYLDIFKDRDVYSQNLKKRLLTHDDTVIIRQCRMKEFVPLLMNEFNEQPVLQRSILRALISFDCDDLLNFFYNIAKEAGTIEIKALALVGLKKCGTKFSYWRQLTTASEEHNIMIGYAQRFVCDPVVTNEIPGDLYSSIFALQYAESNIEDIMDTGSFSWVMDLIRSMLTIGYFDSYLIDFYITICRIIRCADMDILKELLSDDSRTKTFVHIADFLPREYFDQIMPKLMLLGDLFIHRVNSLIAAGKIKIDNRESNAFSYLLWKTGNNL